MQEVVIIPKKIKGSNSYSWNIAFYVIFAVIETIIIGMYAFIYYPYYNYSSPNLNWVDNSPVDLY